MRVGERKRERECMSVCGSNDTRSECVQVIALKCRSEGESYSNDGLEEWSATESLSTSISQSVASSSLYSAIAPAHGAGPAER